MRKFQNLIWHHRKLIWKTKNIEDPILVLKPDVILNKVMDYSFSFSDSLAAYLQDGKVFEVAGIIDKNKKVVQVSKNFPSETQNFTAAHELGHAILHKKVLLHRDKPIDGSTNIIRSQEEMQADKFASYFLMPAKRVEEVFFELFEIPKFIINENNVLAIRERSIGGLKNKCKDIRGLSKLIASAEYYGGKPFNSLAKIFNVSIEAMAIRLEELKLIEF